MEHGGDFERFFEQVEPRLRRAFIGICGVDDAVDATAEALAWGWEHWERVRDMENPTGYLYRVGQSKSRRRRRPSLPSPADLGVPDVEPELVPALLRLTPAQRTAVWLVHGCQWRYGEVAVAMGIGSSTVGTHVSRALELLRADLAVGDHA